MNDDTLYYLLPLIYSVYDMNWFLSFFHDTLDRTHVKPYPTCRKSFISSQNALQKVVYM